MHYREMWIRKQIIDFQLFLFDFWFIWWIIPLLGWILSMQQEIATSILENFSCKNVFVWNDFILCYWWKWNDKFEYNHAVSRSLWLHSLLTFSTITEMPLKVPCQLGSLLYCKYKLKSSEEDTLFYRTYQRQRWEKGCINVCNNNCWQ